MTWVSEREVGACENTEYGMSGSKSDVSVSEKDVRVRVVTLHVRW